MNAYARQNNRINRRMDSPNTQRKFQKVGTEKNGDNFQTSQSPKQHQTVRRTQSNGNSSSRSEGRSIDIDTEPSSLHRTLQRSKSSSYSGDGSRSSGSRLSASTSGSGSSSDKATVESVIELLEILQSSPFAIENNDINTPAVTSTINTDYIRTPPSRTNSVEFFLPTADTDNIRTPPSRTNSAEFYLPSRRSKRAGVRPSPLRMMPKKKSASMRDLYKNEDWTSQGLPKRKGSRENSRFQTEEFQLTSSPTSSPLSKLRTNKRGEDNLSRNQISTIGDFIKKSSKKEHKREQRERRTVLDESWEGSFYQDVPSILGDFHIAKTQRRRSNETLDSLEPVGENHRRHSQLGSQPSHSDLVLHTSSKGGDQKARGKKSGCCAGGKVRNHRTMEDYTGFFLTSPTEENVKHGYGITTFPDGRLFEGVYDQGLMVEGKMTYPGENGSPGSTYVGKFDQDGLRCGKGIYTTSTTTFLGQFRHDQKHGSGILIYHDGNDGVDTSQSRRFIGHWKHGRKHGYGKQILADGTIAQEGLWEVGYFAGNPVSPH